AIQQYIDAVLPFIEEKHDVTVFCVADPELSQRDNENICYIKADKTQDYISGVIDRLNNGYDLIHVFNRPHWVN
ncbi:MAG: glycosyltransferase family 1 protein, partial [Syntrophorhabdus sp.]